MNSVEIGHLFTWYLILLILGLSSLPTCLLLFKNFWDKGYAFAKTISLILITFFVFVLSSAKLIPFSQSSLSWLVIGLVAFNYLFLKKKYFKNSKLIDFFKPHLAKILLQELIFFSLLAFWTYVRGFRPEIDNLEKPMDWGFVNSTLKTTYLPPLDMWFSGQFINYYYFGHLIHAVITKISSVPSTIAYNLSIATVLALTFSQTLSLSASLIKNSLKKISFLKIFLLALTSSVLITFGGNLHHLYKITKINIQNNQKLVLSLDEFKKASLTYWYPDATRFIGYDPDIEDKTIHEFPIYSFVVADLHGHMNNIPVFLLFLSFIFTIFTNFKTNSFINWPLIGGAGFLLSISYMSNAWDFANLGLFFAVFTLIYNLYQPSSPPNPTSSPSNPTSSPSNPTSLRGACDEAISSPTSSPAKRSNLFTIFLKTLINGLLTIVSWFIFTFPFSRNFQPMMEGLKWSDSHSPFWQLFILYGGFWLINLPFLFIFKKYLHKKIKYPSVGQIFVLCLILTATILIVLPEIFYVKDIYIYSHRRANTMFKLVYAAFMMYSISASYVLSSFTQLKNKAIKRIYKFVFVLVFLIHSTYAYFAINSNYGGLKNFQGLDGFVWYQNRYPDTFKAIEWLNNNLTGQPLILEAVGDSYTDFNLVSSATGLPTVEGWIVHEWLWRGGYDQPAARQQDVEAIYQSVDVESLRPLVQKYSIDYILIGDKEFEKYPNLNQDNIAQISDLVFQSNQTKIYKVKK